MLNIIFRKNKRKGEKGTLNEDMQRGNKDTKSWVKKAKRKEKGKIQMSKKRKRKERKREQAKTNTKHKTNILSKR